ncbi:hypothetical protein PGT21_006252 [Puccinia graminis f. sp. tritici]|uniref:Uncharacterized protein n=1 Tax=Puccinia graminis f. sp. tritici TaxID=56615 RepID=A0A5B0PJ75_PUCGR|nr:hypothetical protein PGT21_006252 [Puccinia graminis f. sp. tritici]
MSYYVGFSLASIDRSVGTLVCKQGWQYLQSIVETFECTQELIDQRLFLNIVRAQTYLQFPAEGNEIRLNIPQLARHILSKIVSVHSYPWGSWCREISQLANARQM